MPTTLVGNSLMLLIHSPPWKKPHPWGEDNPLGPPARPELLDRFRQLSKGQKPKRGLNSVQENADAQQRQPQPANNGLAIERGQTKNPAIQLS
jgi:hypothetical protein